MDRGGHVSALAAQIAEDDTPRRPSSMLRGSDKSEAKMRLQALLLLTPLGRSLHAASWFRCLADYFSYAVVLLNRLITDWSHKRPRSTSL